MESGVRVGVWNVCGALSDDERAECAVEEIKSSDADIFVLPEATKNNQVSEYAINTRDHTLRALNSEGYTYNILSCAYEDIHEETDHRPDYKLWVLSRLAVQSCVKRAGIRNYLSLGVTENGKDPLRIDGVHLDDRTEISRINAAMDLAGQDFDIDAPRVVAGDFNALDKKDREAKMYRSNAFRALARLMPQERIRYAGERLHEMGYGTTMKIMKEFGFEDADKKHLSTALLGRFAVLGHLDKILYSQHNARAENFLRHHRWNTRERPVSDHCAISAIIHADDSTKTYF